MIDLDNYRTISILGDRHTGKTTIMFNLVRSYTGNRKIILYGYPKKMKYKEIHSLQILSQITDSIVLMDELQNHIKFYSKATNDTFLELLGVMAHNNNTIIFTTPMTQFITKALDCFIDGFIYTKISDLGSLKNGSKAKRLLQQNSFPEINKWSVSLDIGNYIFVSDDLCGKYKFEDIGIKKDWRKSQKNPKENLKVSQKNPKENTQSYDDILEQAEDIING